MKRLIINFKNVEATPEAMAHSTSVARKFEAKHPGHDRVTVTWVSLTELYVFTGRNHWPNIEIYRLEVV